eukprot:jgi/Psemu1/54946/gm1.54946_g
MKADRNGDYVLCHRYAGDQHGVVVEEPANMTCRIRQAPTISEAEGIRLAPPPKKYSFAEIFNIPEFKGVKTEFEFNCHGDIHKDAAARGESCVDPEFKKHHGMDFFSFEDMKNWINWKASLTGAGGKIYTDDYIAGNTFTHNAFTKPIRAGDSIHMMNDLAPKKKYLGMGLSPLHPITIFLFHFLKDEYHCFEMNDLYNSVLFCKVAVWQSKRVLCHGVAYNEKSGIVKRKSQKSARVNDRSLADEGDAEE